MTGMKRDKAQKKIARCLSILQRDLPDIQASEIPTKFLFLGNAGLTTNADESSLVHLINSTGSCVEAITLIPGKQYSFATFGSIDNAKLVLESAHGLLDIPGSASPVYVAYVNKVPAKPSQQDSPPPGLHIIENFISEAEENMLLKLIDWKEIPGDKTEGSLLKHRQVRHFGYEFKYGSNSVDKENPLPQGIPKSMSNIVQRIVEQGWMPVLPDQLTVNKYLPGQGIPPHVDTHRSFTDEILSLSTGSGVIMDFRLGAHDTEHQYYGAYLPPRSLCIMAGPARYEWTHGICPRMTDVISSRSKISRLELSPRQERISFTFRKIREGDCHCNNDRVCDSYVQSSEKEKSNDASSADSIPDNLHAMRLEQEHVLQVYDQIAGHFSQTRHKPWPQVLEFVTSLPPGAALLDVGCGNGKYLGHSEKIFQVGCDTSYELAKICTTQGFEVMTSNCLQLPFRDAFFDAVICIAVIHHLASEERRLASIKEMARVLKVGGQGLVYVWAMEQQRGKKKSAYLKQNKANRRNEEHYQPQSSSSMYEERSNDFSSDFQKEGSQESSKLNLSQSGSLPVHVNRTEFVQQDMLVPWKLKPQIRKEGRDRAGSKAGNKVSKTNDTQTNTLDAEKSDLEKTEKAESSQTNTLDAEKSDLEKTKKAESSQTNTLDAEKSDLEKTEKAESSQHSQESLNATTLGMHETVVEGQEPVFHRYYHVFKQGELEDLCHNVGGIKVLRSYYDEGNWCIIFEKSC